VRITPTALPDVLLIEPRVFEDERGFFFESWNARRFAEHGIDQRFVQDNHSRSRRHTLRGLHYQVGRPQGKLVRVVAGRVFDVAVDLRRASPTCGRWVGVELGNEGGRMLWIPRGFAHGFCALTETADLVYKCTEYYSPDDERTLAWNDSTVGIDWPLPDGVAPLLSDRDAVGVPLAEAELFG